MNSDLYMGSSMELKGGVVGEMGGGGFRIFIQKMIFCQDLRKL